MRGFDLESMSTTVVALARRVAAILDEYVGLHDALYKFSMRHVIPIPGIFKPIDFGAFHAQLGRLTADLLQVMNVLDGRAVDDMVSPEFPYTTYKTRFKGWINACVAFIEHASSLASEPNTSAELPDTNRERLPETPTGIPADRVRQIPLKLRPDFLRGICSPIT